MPHNGWTTIGVFALFSVAWMLTLVPFASAWLRRDLVARIAIGHAVAWIGLIASAISISRLTASRASPATDSLFIAVFLVGIAIVESTLLWFSRVLTESKGRTRERPVSASQIPIKRQELVAPDHAPNGSRGVGLIPMSVAVVLLSLLVQKSEAIQTLSNTIHHHQASALKILIPITMAGFIGFLSGTLRLSLGEGRPMTTEEIEQLIAQSNLVGRPFWKGGFKYRAYGEAAGVQAERELTVAEIKSAWKSGEWHRNREWQCIFQILLSAPLMIFGGFGIAFFCTPPTVQLIVAGALVYALFQIARMWARA